jgi:hypothetical protein
MKKFLLAALDVSLFSLLSAAHAAKIGTGDEDRGISFFMIAF